MTNSKVNFTNTIKSLQLRQFTYAILGIMSVELLLVGVVIYYLMPKGPILFMIILLMVIVYLYAIYGMNTLLKAAHSLTSSNLNIHLGTRFKCALPISIITSVNSVNITSFPESDIASLTILREGEYLYCLSRKSDIIHISLSKQIMVKAPASKKNKSKCGLIREILINVDEPDAFLDKVTKAACLREQGDNDLLGSNSITEVEDIISYGTTINSGTINTDILPNLELKNLTMYYKDYPSVQNLSVKVFPGEIFGFLGANGAGKTTTIKMITGLLRPTAGNILVGGENLWKPGTTLRRKIGYIPDTPLLYERLTAREHLLIAGSLYNSIPEDITKARIEESLSSLGLQDWADEMIVNYSMGMQRKVSVALALLSDPEIVIVDELTNAFDALTLAEIKEMLIKLRNNGKTVFLSTHVMDVAEKLCDRVGILHKGQLIALGTVKELCDSHGVKGGLEPIFLKLTSTRMEAKGRIG
ncbi:MAG: ABC transporter ATP-binding protein [Clostridia bacterium]|nr:ABC transporter ATP-binding protein [Clostridia bacterium]MDD4048389.1 ABC transporter ATP-binding protein [Clostridia bacterium]